jgi:hypothetical protein
MKNAFFNLTSWLLSDPRRVMIILTIILIVLTVALAAVPGDYVLAEDAIGGS